MDITYLILTYDKDNNNNISIKPLSGEEKLKYNAEVIEGNLVIKFENFNKEKNKGIRWKIIYLK